MIRLRRKGLLALAICVAFVLLAAPAQGAFHLMKIREISGSTAGTNSAYIELQMYAAGQNQVAGHSITFWDQDALVLGMPVPVGSLPLAGPNPPNSQNQRTILIGDSGVAGRDFTVDFTPFIETGVGGNLLLAGAACFDTIDCVSWGAFTGAANIPDRATPYGNPLPTTFALNRNIGRDCPTALDAADDTNNTQADFSPGPEAPRPNAVTPTEQTCESAGVGGVPSLRCRGKEATLRGTAARDNLKGTPQRDVIVVGGGKDKVNGRGGKDLICGEGGNDVLKGGAAKDNLVGGSGKDKLLGGKARDKLFGGGGKDKLFGQKGRDFCNGGSAKDKAKACERERRL